MRAGQRGTSVAKDHSYVKAPISEPPTQPNPETRPAGKKIVDMQCICRPPSNTFACMLNIKALHCFKLLPEVWIYTYARLINAYCGNIVTGLHKRSFCKLLYATKILN